jgi:hypothetical protein
VSVPLPLALLGPALLLAGTLLHPMGADPEDAAAAFADYAADRHWVASHLMQLAGVWAMLAALLPLARRLEAGPAAAWARPAAALAVAGMGLAAALQAVDGVALKRMVDRWAAAAAEPERSALFAAALGVRQVEIGLAATTSLAVGLVAVLLGAALLAEGRLPRWAAWLGLLGGAGTALSGVMTARSGFAGPAMTVNMAGVVLLMAWVAALGLLDRRRRGATAGPAR